MKRMVWLLAGLAGLGLLARLPHPATDVGKLEPVQVVWVGQKDASIAIRTDTGASGEGRTLLDAVEALRENTSAVIHLENAEFMILAPGYPGEESLYEVFRPSCRVCLGTEELDLTAAGAYLSVHSPEATLARLRAGEWDMQTLTLEEGGGSLG